MTWGTQETRAPRNSKKVMVVEDDLAILQLMEFHLDDAGYAVETASTVGEAWRSIVDDPPDALITDVNLPGAFGWELVERCRSDHRFHQIPIVMMSGTFNAEDHSRAKGLGVEFQAKPFIGSEPVEKIGALLKESQKVRMIGARVSIFLSDYKLECTVHLPPEVSRFSDGWAAILGDSRAMISVTDASILTFTDEVMSKAPFLQVAKAQIQLIVPLDEDKEIA